MSRRSPKSRKRKVTRRRRPNLARALNRKDDGIHGVLSSNNIKTCRLTGVTFRQKTVQYSQVDDLAIFEGDINLGIGSPDPKAALSRGLGAGLIFTKSKNRWPNNTIPYTLDEEEWSTFRAKTLALRNIRNAIKHWIRKTSVNFMEIPLQPEGKDARNSKYPNYLHFKPASGCWSHMGMIGGRQHIGLVPGTKAQFIIHEIGHTVGLWHEHSREDRDEYIKINYQNINNSHAHNFKQRVTDGDDVGEYDYKSIMHYGSYAFSENGRTTIDTTADTTADIGTASVLSEGDIEAVEELLSRKFSRRRKRRAIFDNRQQTE